MNTETFSEKITVVERSRAHVHRATLADDVRLGLGLPQKELPPKYFYDERGSNLFEAICDLEEYYQTRTERAILESYADELVSRHRPCTLVEFGSGSSAKTRLLLTAMQRAGTLERYVPIDISREILLRASEELAREYPSMQIEAVIADFNEPLEFASADGPALVAFLGGTIGNFREADAIAFLRNAAAGMRDGDLFLLGVDLVKEPQRLNAAYNDAAGVTAAFNLNLLTVLNEQLQAQFDPGAFSHYAFYNPGESRIEMHLASMCEQHVPIGALEMVVPFGRGETILTEISCKFTRAGAERLLRLAGFEAIEFRTDPEQLFALCLARLTR